MMKALEKMVAMVPTGKAREKNYIKNMQKTLLQRATPTTPSILVNLWTFIEGTMKKKVKPLYTIITTG